MTIYVPGGLIAIFISLYVFYEHNRRNRLRRKERREDLHNLRQEFINQLVKSNANKTSSPGKPHEETDNSEMKA